MLAIRLSRTGKKHQAYFRVVVSDSRRTPTAKFVEILGNYDPHAKKIKLNKERIEYYLKNGAQPSNSVAKLLRTEKIDLPKWVKIEERNRAPKKAAEEAKEAPKAEVAETEAPAEEAATEKTAETEKVEDKKEEAEVAEPVAEEKAAEAAPAETEEAK